MMVIRVVLVFHSPSDGAMIMRNPSLRYSSWLRRHLRGFAARKGDASVRQNSLSRRPIKSKPAVLCRIVVSVECKALMCCGKRATRYYEDLAKGLRGNLDTHVLAQIMYGVLSIITALFCLNVLRPSTSSILSVNRVLQLRARGFEIVKMMLFISFWL